MCDNDVRLSLALASAAAPCMMMQCLVAILQKMLSFETDSERERERERDVRTCLRVLAFYQFSRRMATRHCIIMHGAAADARARLRRTSLSHMHRADYQHTASASVYTLSLVSMSHHKCTI